MRKSLPGVAGPAGPCFNLERFRGTPLVSAPFPHLVMSEALHPEARAALLADFPPIHDGGSFPPSVLSCGPALARLIAELRSPAVAAAFGEKFGLELEGRPTMVTLRGQSREKDGRIHRDSESKLVTALLYFNDGWEARGGRLRLLRQPDDLEDCVLEVPPLLGTLLAFRCSPNAWHGHRPYAGPRRSIQLNWMADAETARREERRHGFSALLKTFLAEERA